MEVLAENTFDNIQRLLTMFTSEKIPPLNPRVQARSSSIRRIRKRSIAYADGTENLKA